MSKISVLLLGFLLVVQANSLRKKASGYCRLGSTSLHDFSDKDVYGSSLELKAFRDRVLLVVNVATYCQYTYQYVAFNKLLEKYRGSETQRCGLTIVGAPCNQFGYQEPGENAQEILNGLQYVRPGYGFKTELVLLKKRDVNGAKQHPLYTWLKVSRSSLL